jgi:hypothetical protein
MNDIEKEMLNYRRVPARLDAKQTAALLGFMPYEIPVLVKARLLRPLGDPAANAHKYWSSVEILALAQDRQWLDRATRTVTRHWQMNRKNHKHLLDAA